MKLHSEISVGWVILYASIVALLPGENLSGSDSQSAANSDAYQKQLINHDYNPNQDLKVAGRSAQTVCLDSINCLDSIKKTD